MRAVHAFDALVAHTPLPAMPVWMVDLLEERDDMPEPAFEAAVVNAIRIHVFEDFEDPGRDPDLGPPT